MKKFEPYPVASALFFIFEIFYIVCMLGRFILQQFGIEGFWHMHKLWEHIIPGFAEGDLLSFLIGFFIVGLGSYISGYILVPVYNFLIDKKNIHNITQTKPIFLRFKTLFFTILTYMLFLFTICIVYDLFIPKAFDMSYIWHLLLPGFHILSLESYLIGVFDIIVYSFYSASIIAGVLNYFENVQFVNVQ